MNREGDSPDYEELYNEIHSQNKLIDSLKNDLNIANKLIPKWISVNDELPKENGMHLVFTDFGDVATIRTFSVELGFLDVHITHWMPLPSTPILTSGV
jgi:hypothetical protein